MAAPDTDVNPVGGPPAEGTVSSQTNSELAGANEGCLGIARSDATEMIAMDDRSGAKPSRRQVLKGVGVLGGLAVAGGIGWQAIATDDPPAGAAKGGGGNAELDKLADSAVSGGPPKDGIPAIDEPKFVGVLGSEFLADDEPVFGLIRDGEIRAYPQMVLVYHEIVNDTVAGQRIAVTYCPLTGTVMGFIGLPDRPGLTFGTTGRLVNSNLLMYDRETDSEWPQILGTAISGELYGQQLQTVPLAWSTWKAWRTAHPGTRVLIPDTGALRDYGSDPYGSYPDSSGYYAGGEPIFPVSRSDKRLPPKEVVIGVRSGDRQLAIRKDRVRRERTVEVKLGATAVRAEWDDTLDTVRVVRDNGEDHADFMDAMWFAWYAFYPRTQVVS